MKLYHGGRLDGPVEIRGQAKKSMQHGPGFYLTDSMSRAREYAKGGDRVFEVEVEPQPDLSEVRVPGSTLVNWVKTTPKLRNRKALLEDLQTSITRAGDPISPVILLNLALYHDALGAKTGPELARFLAAKGAKWQKTRMYGSETWYTVFDPIRSRPQNP